MKPSTLRQGTYQHHASLSQTVKHEHPDTYQPQESPKVEANDLVQELNESSRLRRIRSLNQSYLEGLNQFNSRSHPSLSNSESTPSDSKIDVEVETTPPKSFQSTSLSNQRVKKATLHQTQLNAPLSGPPRII
jgi:hypothetical protein